MKKKYSNCKQEHNVDVSLSNEIVQNILKGNLSLSGSFIHRVLAFSISGTLLVDLKDNSNIESKLSARLLPDYLAEFLTTMVKMTERQKLS